MIPGMQSGRYDFIAAPTTVTRGRGPKHMLFNGLPVDRVPGSASKKGSEADQGTAPISRASRSRNKGTPYETL